MSTEYRMYLSEMTEYAHVKAALFNVSDRDFTMYYSTWENVLRNHLEPHKYVTGIAHDPMFELMEAKF